MPRSWRTPSSRASPSSKTARAFQLERPDGRLLPEVPRPPAMRGDPVEVLRARHEAEGFVLHALTATPGWLGERLDLGWAIDVLHPLAR